MNVQRLKRVVPQPLWPYLRAVRRWARAIPPRPLLQKKRLLSDPSLDQRERELLAGVSGRIDYNDGMYDGNGAHYYKVGLSAIQCIEEAIDLARLATIRRALDLPCVHGRVLRFLVQRFPEAQFAASDLDRTGVDFCARMFGAEAVYSKADLNQLSLEHRFDLIWCGSLITHFDAPHVRALIGFFERHLSHGGTGFGFVDYPKQNAWGVSLASDTWVRALVEQVGGVEEVYFRAQGWDDHQDVYGFVKANSPAVVGNLTSEPQRDAAPS